MHLWLNLHALIVVANSREAEVERLNQWISQATFKT